MFDLNPVSPQFIAKEKAKARELRQTQWWKQKLAAGVCHYCEQKFAPAALTMDHVIPVARGGHSSKGNVVPCCKECNTKKRYYTPAELVLQSAQKPEDHQL